MAVYASSTKVTRSATGAEIERIFTRFGAQKFAAGWEQDRGFITFVYGSRTVPTRTITIHVPMPARDHPQFTHTPNTKVRRSASAAQAEYDKAVRARWRALALVIKAMLVGVEAGIIAFEDAFLGFTVLPGGATVSQHLLPYVNQAIQDGHLPALPATMRSDG
jgi:hypothetical protein